MKYSKISYLKKKKRNLKTLSTFGFSGLKLWEPSWLIWATPRLLEAFKGWDVCVLHGFSVVVYLAG